MEQKKLRLKLVALKARLLFNLLEREYHGMAWRRTGCRMCDENPEPVRTLLDRTKEVVEEAEKLIEEFRSAGRLN
jgi:hypothetical protein